MQWTEHGITFGLLTQQVWTQCSFPHCHSPGRLWRKEWDKPTETFGQIRQSPFLDNFFSYVFFKPALRWSYRHFRKLTWNTSGQYDSQYPFLVMRGPEYNFLQAKGILRKRTKLIYTASPIVFTDLRDNRLYYGGSLSIPFQPELLSIPGNDSVSIGPNPPDDKEFKLYHAVSLPPGGDAPEIPGFIQRSLADKLLDQIEIGMVHTMPRFLFLRTRRLHNILVGRWGLQTTQNPRAATNSNRLVAAGCLLRLCWDEVVEWRAIETRYASYQ